MIVHELHHNHDREQIPDKQVMQRAMCWRKHAAFELGCNCHEAMLINIKPKFLRDFASRHPISNISHRRGSPYELSKTGFMNVHRKRCAFHVSCNPRDILRLTFASHWVAKGWNGKTKHNRWWTPGQPSKADGASLLSRAKCQAGGAD